MFSIKSTFAKGQHTPKPNFWNMNGFTVCLKLNQLFQSVWIPFSYFGIVGSYPCIEILFRFYLLPFIGSKWFSEFSETYLCLRGKGKPSFILLRSANKEKSIQILFNIVMEKIRTVLQIKLKRQRWSKILNLNR